MDIYAEGLPDGRCSYDFLRFALFKDAAFFKHNYLVAVLGCQVKVMKCSNDRHVLVLAELY